NSADEIRRWLQLPTIDAANAPIVATKGFLGNSMRSYQIGLSVILLLTFLGSTAASGCAASADTTTPKVMSLHDGWQLQSSSKLTETAEVLSSKAFKPRGWYQTKIPSTVLAAQVAAVEFPDPYFGMNLRKIPGTTYPIGHLF